MRSLELMDPTAVALGLTVLGGMISTVATKTSSASPEGDTHFRSGSANGYDQRANGYFISPASRAPGPSGELSLVEAVGKIIV